ncbi:MAG: phosphotransferase family protein, partial [Candidatus Omnitrophica bacterium]|nr:phosphotransferase family protein [Candidatus Omnitrophota bacterium]
LAYTEDESILGCPFYVMERIEGIILRRELPQGLSFTPQEARALCERFIEVYAALHHVDYRKAGLEGYGKPEGYVRRQVEGWSDRYRSARTEDAPDFEPVIAWLHAKMPAESAIVSVIHNDYRFDNVVLDPRNPLEIIGVLDWEMATIGDPLMDLGGALAYWVDRHDPPNMQAIRIAPTHLEGMMTRRELINAYAGRMDMTIENIDFYYCFGLFRLAVIAQQIYYRFYYGQTKDERFKLMIFAVHVLQEAAKKVIEASAL